MRHATLLCIALASTAACDGEAPEGDAGPDEVTVSCDRSALYLCEEYLVPSGRAADLEESCTGSDGDWIEGGCPSGSFGGCLEDAGDGQQILFYYPEGTPQNAADVMAICDENDQDYVAP